MMRAEDEAIRPKTPMPFLYVSPEDPKIAKAVMFVLKSDMRSTNGPMLREATKKSAPVLRK